MRSSRVTTIVLAALGLLFLGPVSAIAGTDQYGNETVVQAGAKAGTADHVAVTTTPTAVPATPLASRTSITVQNLGPNDIYCGPRSDISATNGFKVAANGGSYTANLGPSLPLYCICPTALQVSPADTHYQEL